MEENEDILFVCAAGNNGNDLPVYPAAFDLENVVSIASISNTGELSSTSNYGIKVNIAAPGQDIYTAAPNNEYCFVSGTSMAAAYVSAAVALYLGNNSTESANYLKSRLLASVASNEAILGKVSSNGYLNIENMFFIDLTSHMTESDELEALKKEFAVNEQVLTFLTENTFYDDLSYEQKEQVRKIFFVRDETMIECFQFDLNIKNSIRIAIIMQRLNISFQDTMEIIEKFASMDIVYSESEHINSIKRDYLWYNFEQECDMVQYLKKVYPAKNIIFSFIVAKAFALNQTDIIKDMPSIEEIENIYTAEVSNNELVDQTDIDRFKRLVRIYCISPNIIADYINEHQMTIDDFYSQLISFEYENNVLIDPILKPLDNSEGNVEPSYSDFKLTTSDGVNISNGSLDFNDPLVAISGRNGLDLNLILQYNSGYSNSKEAYSENYQNKSRNIQRLSPLDYMGNGWRFEFPFVSRSSSGVINYYRSADGATYEYDSSTVSHLKNHFIRGIIFTIDYYSTFTNGVTASQYYVTYSDGKKRIF